MKQNSGIDMKKPVKIIVEGIADEKFLKDYFQHIFSESEISDEEIIVSGGWTHINSQKNQGETIRNHMQRNTADDGVNFMIFDADEDFATRKNVIEQWKAENHLNFELFLFPNNNDSGDLEHLLEKIITDQNQPIFDCWERYETCLQEHASKIIGKKMTTPPRKTKIYGYLEALLGVPPTFPTKYTLTLFFLQNVLFQVLLGFRYSPFYFLCRP